MNEYIEKLKEKGLDAINEDGVLIILAKNYDKEEAKIIHEVMKDYNKSYGIRSVKRKTNCL